jgi:glycosyltransferase involved in cell wall biosynthesis
MLTYALNELLLSPHALALSNIDIYHSTLYRFMPAVRARRRVATHHDCIQERYPHLFHDHARIIRTKRRMFNRADLVFCVSEASRKDLQEFYGVEPERTRVVYNGVSSMYRSEPGGRALTALTRRPFLLYVGLRAAYKNFNGLLDAFARSGVSRSYDLLVIGGGAFTEAETQMVRQLNLQEAIIPVPSANSELLAEAYAKTSLLVYPSLYEGFGLPPLEAMMMGAATLVARSPATVEVCQDAAIFFDPLDKDDFVDKLLFALGNDAARKEKINRGLELVRQYQWQTTAEQVLAGYRSLF